MRILIIVDPDHPVPPVFYGGIERVADLFAAEFTRLGHTVDLLAGPGSRRYASGQLFIHYSPSKHKFSRARRKIQFQLQSIIASRQCDVVCNFGRFDYLESLLYLKVPVLQIFENPIDQLQVDFAEQRVRGKILFQCISSHQHQSVKFSYPSIMVPNPIATNRYSLGSGDGGYLAFLGRLTSNKGVDVAIKAAQLASKPLLIAGPVPNEPGAMEFFKNKIQPHLFSGQVRWLGTVDDVVKQHLLGRAEALLFPIRWDEPFGIVMTESLACGTPVIATNRASTPDVVKDGFNGFLCSPEEPDPLVFAEAVRKLSRISRTQCRADVESRFGIEPIASRLLAQLQSLVTA